MPTKSSCEDRELNRIHKKADSKQYVSGGPWSAPRTAPREPAETWFPWDCFILSFFKITESGLILV